MKYLINPPPRKHDPVKPATAGDSWPTFGPMEKPDMKELAADGDPGNDMEDRKIKAWTPEDYVVEDPVPRYQELTGEESHVFPPTSRP